MERDGAFLVVCEHASRRIPDQLGDLGLGDEALESHIAWDIGALGVAQALAEQLDSPLVSGAISRLVYDLNRPPDAPDAIPAQSESWVIPGNRDLTSAGREVRIEGIYRPFEATLAEVIRTRRPAALVTVHSFTPRWFGVPRAVEIGILCGTETALAEDVLRIARASAPGRDIRLNDPYGPEDGVAHTLDHHGAENGIPSVMIEIRNDLIADESAHAPMAAEIAGWLEAAVAPLAQGIPL